ncbi:helix-turn-helix domain-containing protein [Acetanaerobacterium elongatum]|uniref:AraC-type DNA-binding protein n=1 Tax=Acetanaerobacterium elongatum TaxID=258515 RepID=A0A1H0DVL8_9FIRM|nr:helix-turn-helix transcriptional regulator [Acetanaerobacterium elongatum]SDN74244.1 AraC-type DNA-binding protein [Acetanaerobacterium elongatum]
MDYSTFIWSVSSYVEKRVKDEICYAELEKAMGFSYRHIREVFRECTNRPLASYILSRRIANAAFEVAHTRKSLTAIAGEYGFDSYDVFTRAFKRETGYTPKTFRENGIPVGRGMLNTGMFAPTVSKEKYPLLMLGSNKEEQTMKSTEKTDNSCILYGVPKVEYSFEECTPFPASLKACLNYMGQMIDYSYVMASSGASFRLRWNKGMWDGGNVDIQCIYENPLEAFERSFKAAGRSVRFLQREESSKEGFMAFIKEEVDNGRPLIAQGIIGPPEACIITGYADGGETLMGWNFFQNNPDFAKGVTLHETGYFITKSWWENKDTLMLMAIGEEQAAPPSVKEILLNAVDIMTRDSITIKNRYGSTEQVYAGGPAAYEAWAAAITNDAEFSKDAILPLLFERLVCQTDAQVMVSEGRLYAAYFLNWVGQTNPAVAKLCEEAAKLFKEAAQATFKMNELKGGFEQNEATVRLFAQPEVRREIAKLILKAKNYDEKAAALLKEICEKL